MENNTVDYCSVYLCCKIEELKDELPNADWEDSEKVLRDQKELLDNFGQPTSILRDSVLENKFFLSMFKWNP